MVGLQERSLTGQVVDYRDVPFGHVVKSTPITPKFWEPQYCYSLNIRLADKLDACILRNPFQVILMSVIQTKKDNAHKCSPLHKSR